MVLRARWISFVLVVCWVLVEDKVIDSFDLLREIALWPVRTESCIRLPGQQHREQRELFRPRSRINGQRYKDYWLLAPNLQLTLVLLDLEEADGQRF